jgi:hypothetical protein
VRAGLGPDDVRVTPTPAASEFLDWLASPPGWPLRCLLAERRKDRANNFDPKFDDFTQSSGGAPPSLRCTTVQTLICTGFAKSSVALFQRWQRPPEPARANLKFTGLTQNLGQL